MLRLLRKTMKNNMSSDSLPETQGAFLDKVTSDTDGFTDAPVVHQCDVQIRL